MKVLVDAHMLGNKESGNETYVENLLVGLSTINGCQVGAAIKSDLQACPKLSGLPIERKPLSPLGDWPRLIYSLPRLCRQYGADVLHVTYVAPLYNPCPIVVSVHDISFKRYPDFFSPRDRLLFAVLLPMSLRRAHAVLTLSEHAKAEILDIWPFLTGKTYAVPLAASEFYRPMKKDSNIKKILQKHKIISKFILAVGNLQPRKNLVRLIHAFADVHKEFRDYQLVIVGKDQWQSSSLYSTVENLGLANAVVFTGYVPYDELPYIYNAADLFVYPSLYEGFGLPILEAMACGTPVVSSNTASMPEVAGPAALLIDPTNIEEITQAIIQVLADVDLAHQLSSKGLAQANRFSWHKTAEETLKVYKSVLR